MIKKKKKKNKNKKNKKKKEEKKKKKERKRRWKKKVIKIWTHAFATFLNNTVSQNKSDYKYYIYIYFTNIIAT